MLTINNLSKQFGNKILFKNLNMSLPCNGIFILKGENGSGKSTFFKILANIDKEYEGSILFNNKKIINNIYYYDPDINLYDGLTVKENLKIVSKDYLNILKNTDLEYLLNKKIDELSKGEKARVGLIKSLLLDKEILLLDEPFDFLDLNNANLFFELFKEYSKNHLVIVINHKYEEINLKIDNEFSLNNISFKETNGEPNKVENKKINKLFLSFKLFLKTKLRSIISVFLSLISFVCILFSLNSYLYNKQEIFNNALEAYNISIVQTKLSSREEESKYYDINDKIGLLINSYITLDSHSLKLPVYISLGNELQINNKIYVSNSLHPTLYANKRIINFLNLNNISNEANLSLSSFYNHQQKFNIVEFDDLNDDFSFLFLDDLNLSNIYLDNYDNFGFDTIFNKIDEEINNVMTLGSILKGEKENLNVSFINKAKTNLELNEANLLINKALYEKHDNFDEFFNKSFLNKKFKPKETNSFSLNSYLECLIIKGYKVIDEVKKELTFSYGLEINNELIQLINNNNYLDSPLSNPHNPFYLTKTKSFNSTLYKYHFSNLLLFNNGEKIDINYVENIFQLDKIITPIIFTIGIVSFILLMYFILVINKINFSINETNIYVMKKDGINNFNIENILVLPQTILVLISFIISSLLIFPFNKFINKLFFNKFSTAPSLIILFNYHYLSIIILIFVLILIFGLSYYFIYKSIKKNINL